MQDVETATKILNLWICLVQFYVKSLQFQALGCMYSTMCVTNTPDSLP
jgi:hypothetical protein